MEKIVFYSWQSDLPNNSNRNFIEKALTKAVKAIAEDESVRVVPVIDRDTAGVGGSPDISATIFGKISKSNIVVSDVSIINKDAEDRKVPNPNVLVELGYALSELGYEKVVLVMNAEFGAVEQLPFDLRTKRVVTYDTSKDKQKEADALAKKLEIQLKTIFENEDPAGAIQPSIIDVINGQKPDRIPAVRGYMKSLYRDIENLYPGDGMLDSSNADPEYDEKIIDALSKTTGLVATFRSVVDEIAVFDDLDSLKKIFNGFKPILESYKRKKGDKDGTFHKAKYDYYRFLGNELFVILVSILLREDKWDLLKFVLEESIIIDNFNGEQPASVDYTYFSKVAEGFYFRKQRLKSNRVSLRYDLLMERRKSEEDKSPSSVEEYTSADLLLFLKGETKKINSTDVSIEWSPWSLVSFEMPRFILLAQKKSYAESIAYALGIPHAQDLQVLLKNKTPKVSKLSGSEWGDIPIREEHIEQIGSR